MNWSEAISKAIEYIENNLTNDITIEDISNYAYISPFYFKKGSAMLCGYSLSEYIRNRKLSVAGYELLNTNNKIIDLALNMDMIPQSVLQRLLQDFMVQLQQQFVKAGK